MTTPHKFTIDYKKTNVESKIMNDLQEHCHLHNIQQYIPLYKRFFTLQHSNWNSIQLNSKYHITHLSPSNKIEHSDSDSDSDSDEEVIPIHKHHVYNATISDSSNNTINTQCFLKYIPIYDVFSYLSGKVDVSGIDLPTYEMNLVDNWCYPKDRSTSYTDSFFYYLSSMLKNYHDFPHGIDYYGTYLGNKHGFLYNVMDEIDILQENSHFVKNMNKDFSFVDENIFFSQTRKNKQPIQIQNNNDISLNIDDCHLPYDSLFKAVGEMDINNNSHTDISMEQIYYSEKIANKKKNNKSDNDDDDDETKSNSKSDSNSNNESESESDNNESESESDYDSDSDSYCSSVDTDTELQLNIKKYPVQAICLEYVKGNTLDDYIIDTIADMDESEALIHWKSILIQVCMILITYSKTFDLVHNDLHTNNIMYVNTEKKYIKYTYNSKTFTVPTFGKIWKIIDFGRATYKFRGRDLWSSDYNMKGEAATQYNTPPYYNSNRPEIKPNNAFDLCRLGCSLFDIFIDEQEIYEKYDSNKINDVTDMYTLVNWMCKSDNGENILYRDFNVERNPGFKLYKAISRNVHNTTPDNLLQTSFFKDFNVSNDSNKIQTDSLIEFNIDCLPFYGEKYDT